MFQLHHFADQFLNNFADCTDIGQVNGIASTILFQHIGNQVYVTTCVPAVLLLFLYVLLYKYRLKECQLFV